MTRRRVRTLAVPALLATWSLTLAGAQPAVAASASAAADRPSYSWSIKPTGSTEEFRGLAAVSDRVAWVSGEAGTVLRTSDAGRTWKDVSPVAAAGLALRDIEAWDAREAVALSIGTGQDSRIFRTSDGGSSWTERFRNADPDAFYDCMAFSGSGRGLALSDPVGGYFQLALTRDFGRTWRVQDNDGMPPAVSGEFAFAASGTCLVSGRWRNFWFVTGGIDTPRIFHSDDGGRTWDVTDVPLRGGPTAGIYSVDFRAAGKGVMVGGDFADETNGDDASAYLNYASNQWLASTRPVLGYRSGVSFLPRTENTAIAVGPTGSDVSDNGGRTWVNFDADRYDGIACAEDGACWASGTDGRVAKLRRR